MKSLLLISFLTIFASFSTKSHKPGKALKDFVYFSEEETKGDAFYIHKYEVSNKEYKLFLDHIKKHKPNEASSFHPIPAEKNLCLKEPFFPSYLTHPAYSEYPVVGVSHAQALAFCDWRTEIYHKNPKRKFKKIVFDLPTKVQWNIAANSGTEPQAFPWEGTEVKNKKGAWKANFNYYATKVKCEYTSPVDGGLKSAKGIFNLAGNVEEFTKEYGITKGGSWNDPIDFLKNDSEESYSKETEQSSERGFRMVLTVIEK